MPIVSIALIFGLVRPGLTQVKIPDFAGKSVARKTANQPTQQTAVLAGGCFWGVDGVFKHVKGVSRVVSGYAGGNLPDPNYEMVSAGTTGYAESVEITYDPTQLSYAELLKIFFSVATDPTELNRQGPDEGTQYRSIVFYRNDRQQQIAQSYINQLERAQVFPAPIVTQLMPLRRFYPAEAYHQDFLAKHPQNPYIVYNDLPKIEQLQKQFPNRYRP
ncbi:MAG: peptide-methionine (S)-S-oxide reductase MsrA [Candidatus Binataceae bacterium]|nr:peptide-methionine (S)-S-oxide reductase MsrA [Candidatus Binataceae bacterium]